MTGTQERAPVGEWLRGRAQAHRRAAATYERSGQTSEADVHRRVAAELGDVAAEADLYAAGDQP